MAISWSHNSVQPGVPGAVFWSTGASGYHTLSIWGCSGGTFFLGCPPLLELSMRAPQALQAIPSVPQAYRVVGRPRPVFRPRGKEKGDVEAVCHTASGEGGQLCREQRFSMNALLVLSQLSCYKWFTVAEISVTDVSTEDVDGSSKAEGSCSRHSAIR